MARTVFDVLKDRMDEDISSALQFLGSGGAQDFAQYKEVTGLLRGLRSCVSHVGTLLKTESEKHREYITSIMGIVIDMGKTAFTDEDRFPDGAWCKVGDYVMFRMNTGTRFTVSGKEFRLMNDDSIEAVIPDPRGICRV